MKIQFAFLDKSKGTFKPDSATRWIKGILEAEGKKAGEITFIITNDDHLLDINRKFLNHDYYTDVISFGEHIKNQINGDVFISRERVEANAASLGNAYGEELLRVMVHGLLHLIGYGDDSEMKKMIMTELEDKYVVFGLDNYGL